MAVQKPYTADRTPGQPVSTASSGITWTTSSRPRVVEYKDGIVRRTVITVPAFSFTTTAAAKAIGQKIYTLPEGWILPRVARVTMSSTTGATTTGTAGEVGLGTVVGSGAVATLGGTGTFEDIMAGATLSNHVAQTALSTDVVSATDNGVVLDGTGTANDVFLNIASTYNGTGGVTVNGATVEILWTWIGDK